jgi:hypothetical protein
MSYRNAVVANFSNVEEHEIELVYRYPDLRSQSQIVSRDPPSLKVFVDDYCEREMVFSQAYDISHVRSAIQERKTGWKEKPLDDIVQDLENVEDFFHHG